VACISSDVKAIRRSAERLDLGGGDPQGGEQNEDPTQKPTQPSLKGDRVINRVTKRNGKN